ncbi:calcium-binding mitochondrial carrier protein SCaMC-2 isoform X3 [Danaus plexippus]|uniref:calcium-binding mitochondrial carrier protein SCaMC-2 isoform X3 n=1 Tax=Danaus plexippus TaxID=13037 RepID=UPI0013C4CF57|nr:calcium-binding mitochondrial carrier protein SCaMC-2 isoform X3 [Danaus plexippus]
MNRTVQFLIKFFVEAVLFKTKMMYWEYLVAFITMTLDTNAINSVYNATTEHVTSRTKLLISRIIKKPNGCKEEDDDTCGAVNTYLDIGEDMNVPDDFTPTELQTGKWWRHLLAGGIAGAVSRTCTAPLDRLKVFLQVNPTRENMAKCLAKMINEGGIGGLWRGNGINVIKIAPESALKFAAYEQVKRLIKGEKNPLEIYERFLAGASAGAISQTVIYPLEVLKTRLALRKTGQYSGIVDAAKKIYAREGLKCFYKGYIPNILGIVPYAGIDLAVYETLKKKYINKYQTNNEQPGMLLLLACGSTSCTLGQVCSYPLALVRTRLQAQEKAAKGAEGTMRGAFREIVQREGLRGLYRGITPNFIKVIPAVSISYVVYEYASRSLGVNMT